MLLSLIIPICNEALHLAEFLKRIDALKLPTKKELIFIDDKSSDGSLEILRRHKFKSTHQILEHRINMGKGASIRDGIAAAHGDIIGIQDADFEYDMNDIETLIEPLRTNKADIVYGSRFSGTNGQVHRTFHYLVNRFLTLLSNVFSGLYLSDMETCYKFFRADIIKNIVLHSNRFGFEPEITAKIALLKTRIKELPIHYYPRNYVEGKKITWRDGFAALWHLLHYNYFASKKRFFTPGLPGRYIPSGRNFI